jgi:hypothetical protein
LDEEHQDEQESKWHDQTISISAAPVLGITPRVADLFPPGTPEIEGCAALEVAKESPGTRRRSL